MAIKDFHCQLLQQESTGIKTLKTLDPVKLRAATHSLALDSFLTNHANGLQPFETYQLRVTDLTNGKFIETYLGQIT
jgi:hypothetical protein